MKSIFKVLSNYFTSYFHLQAYLSIGFFLTVLISLNYYFNVEDDYIDAIENGTLRFGLMFLFQAIPYLVTILILTHYKCFKSPFKSKKFWLLIGFGFSILALDRAIDFSHLIQTYFIDLNYSYTRKIANFSSGFILIILPLIAFALLTKDQHRIYGLLGKFNGIRPYAFLLFGSFICVFIGGFFSDIQSYYPIYLQNNPNYFQQKTGVSNLTSILLYEIPYALSFVTVELFFRGFLLFAFIKYLGKYAVLPMAVTYCVLHFGKPMTESISSIFGGTILGIIALKHKNIRGGILIHVGMAWSMEIIGYLHKVL